MNFKYHIIICFLIGTMATVAAQNRNKKSIDWPLYSYNFGGLQEYEPEKQVQLLHGYGYKGMALMANFKNKMVDLEGYFEEASTTPNFDIHSVFFRYNFNDDPAVKSGWMPLIDEIAGKKTDLWFIFGRPAEDFDEKHIDSVLNKVVDYADKKGVQVVLYPHHHDVIPTVEDAYTWVKKLNAPNLKLAYHTCHELRSGNGDRAEEILTKVYDKLGAVTISGADSIIDYTNAKSIENSSIKPLYRGNYDVFGVLNTLKKLGYTGKIGYINHLITEDLDVYMPKSLEVYQNWIAELNQEKTPKGAFDAPDQATWHEPSRTWFVSNLGNGISLERDNYGWISRLDETGKVLSPQWLGPIEGLHAPSGMTITDEYLYVCDRDGVHEISITKAEVANFYPLPGGEFINDIAMAENGDFYISDFFGNRIYKLPKSTRKAEIWLETDDLQTPDGLYIDNGKLIVACWGVLSNPATFETSKLGDVLSIDLKTKKITTLMQEVGNLEGITKAGNHYYITDWAAGKLLKVNLKKKSVETLLAGLKNPTDPDYSADLRTIAFPQHGTDQVLLLKIDTN